MLLLSNSKNHGSGYLDHVTEPIAELFSGIGRILFVPFALHDQVAYWRLASERLADLGIEVDRLEEGPDAPAAVASAAGMFVGGGNTFRLLDRLQRCGAVETIRRRVLEGMPYLGSSAGTVIAAPSLKTTNDMPIVQPASFEALSLVPFQLNCHYLDADPSSTHMGETREQRIREFLEENDIPVVGLREGGMIQVRSGTRPIYQLQGAAGARVFSRGRSPQELEPGDALDAIARPRGTS